MRGCETACAKLNRNAVGKSGAATRLAELCKMRQWYSCIICAEVKTPDRERERKEEKMLKVCVIWCYETSTLGKV